MLMRLRPIESLESWRSEPECSEVPEGLAAELNLSKPTVGKWRSRFLERRLDGLVDEPH